MNIILLTLHTITDIESRGIYADLMRMFRNEGHQVYIISSYERRYGLPTSYVKKGGAHFLYVKTLNIEQTSIVEKGLGTIVLDAQYKRAIRKYLGHIRFDLILYPTPPITLSGVVHYLQKKNPQAVSYLLLKDIFPQNAVDIGLFGKNSLFYWYFRKKEKELYKLSDYIGCMSPANVEYIRKHNTYYPADHVEVAPNSIEIDYSIQVEGETVSMRKKYGLPLDKPIFIYGGNLGKPQGIDYFIKCLDAVQGRTDCFFLIVGNGMEYHKIKEWCESHPNANVKLVDRLLQHDYDLLVYSCDIGLIFLDHRFTIPNFPSRILSYLENKMPVLCATDVNTDIGKIAEQNGFGYWCESVNPDAFRNLVDKMLSSDIKAMGERGFHYLKENYLVEHTYNAIVKHI